MKKALMLAIVTWFVLFFSSGSSACGLCAELGKRGFSPEEFNKTIAEYFGASPKVSDSGKPFLSAGGAPFNLAISKDGKLYPVTSTKQLRGVVFDGSINARPVKIFVLERIGFVGVKADWPVQKEQISLPIVTSAKKIVTFVPSTAPIARETTPILALAPKAAAAEELKTTQPTLPVQAEQIIETSMNDASTLLLPAERALQEQKEVAVKTEQLVKRVEYKKKEKNQKFLDAGVTSAAIGTAFIPGVGPFIASGIILSRVVYGLFQSDPDEDEQGGAK